MAAAGNIERVPDSGYRLESERLERNQKATPVWRKLLSLRTISLASGKLLGFNSPKNRKFGKTIASLLVLLAVLALAVFSTPAAHAQTIIATISEGFYSHPLGVAVDTSTDAVYVTLNGANTISVVNGTTNSITTNIYTTSPWGVGVNPLTHMVYVANTSSIVTVINGVTNAIVRTISVCNDARDVAVNPGPNLIYVTCQAVDALAIIDGNTNTVIRTLQLGAFMTGALPVTVNPATNTVYVGDGKGPNVIAINGTTDSVIATLSVVGPHLDFGLAANPATNKVYVSDSYAGSVAVIDGATNAFTGITINVGLSATPEGIGVDATKNAIYVATVTHNTLFIISGATNTVTDSLILGGALGVGVNPATNRIFVSDYNTPGLVYVISEPASTATSVVCGTATVTVDQSTQCTATVTDTSSTPTTPTGTVGFTTNSTGTFTGSPCILSGSGISASCSVIYTPASGSEGHNLISGTYSADSSHTSSAGTSSVTVTKRSTTTGVSCSHSHKQGFSCTATVSDVSPGTPLTPAGIVAWTSGGIGAFSSSGCTLSGSGPTASCTVSYTSSTKHLIVTITASYSGDTDHFRSVGSTTITT